MTRRTEWPVIGSLTFDEGELEQFLQSRAWLFYQKCLRDAAMEVSGNLCARVVDGPRDHWAGQAYALEYAITLGNSIAAHHMREAEHREDGALEQERETEDAIRAALEQEQKNEREHGNVEIGGNYGRWTWRIVRFLRHAFGPRA